MQYGTELLGDHDPNPINARKHPGLCRPQPFRPSHAQSDENAIQALQNRENPILRVVAEQLPTGNIRLQVIDNGPGIPSDMINEIFVPFFTTKNEGTGIGLSIARQIMRAHGGNLKVSSIPDKETVFTLVL